MRRDVGGGVPRPGVASARGDGGGASVGAKACLRPKLKDADLRFARFGFSSGGFSGDGVFAVKDRVRRFTAGGGRRAGGSGGASAGTVTETWAGKECEIPNFGGSYLGRFPLVSANFWTSDHLSERSRRVDAFPGTIARGTLVLKRS